MTEKFTPGPWKRKDTAEYAEILSNDSRIVAMVGLAADADFIAAAPEMYEALEKAQWAEFIDSDHGKITFCTECRNEQKLGHYEGCSIAAALSAAKGEL